MTATLQIGVIRTILFTLLAYTIAFLSEFSSTRIGFPYGFYRYLETTRGEELFVANVPFMDSLSYTFLAYVSFSLALLVSSPLIVTPNDLKLADTYAIRHSWPVLFLSVVFFVFLDVVIDPVALRGSRWFLGQIFEYEKEGIYFGVPISNFLGWAFVGFLTIFLFQSLDHLLAKIRFRDFGIRDVRYKALFGPLLYYAVLLFNLAVTFSIGESLLGIVGLFLFIPVTVVVSSLFFKESNRATSEEVAAHLKDFP
ncbi:MAG: carotenoid biosynthesis protein [Candidatus Tectomicrobia bacterium]|nr:carotenoid biosynthesis protein [Candidatus Tectomicrobia bacterium]